MQSRNNSACRCAHAGVIFSPPHLGLSIRGCRLEAIDTTRGYVMQQGSKEKHTVGLDCPQFNRSNVDTIVHRSWTGKHQHIERLRCTACDHEFSEREGTLMARSKLAEDTVERLLKCQRWGVCDEGTADICEVDLKTVYRFQRVATQRAQTHHQQVVRDVDVPGVPLDEAHAKLRPQQVEW